MADTNLPGGHRLSEPEPPSDSRALPLPEWEQFCRIVVADIEATADWLQDPQRRRVQQKTLEAVERAYASLGLATLSSRS